MRSTGQSSRVHVHIPCTICCSDPTKGDEVLISENYGKHLNRDRKKHADHKFCKEIAESIAKLQMQ